MSENAVPPPEGPPGGQPGGQPGGDIPSGPSSSAQGEPTIKDKNNGEIVNIIKSELKDVYFCKNEENDKKLVEQTGQDLQKIYYLDYSKKQVHPNIKREIIQSWHRALRVKIDDKLKKCQYKGHCEQPTGATRYNGGEKEEKKTDDAGGNTDDAGGNTETTGNGASGQTPPPNGANGPAMPTPPASSNQYIINFAKSKPKMFIEELATKSILNSYTASAVYNLHYQLIKKVNCNYAIIERPQFDLELHKQFQRIYELFDGYLTTLSNKKESTPVFNIKPEPKSMFGGNDGKGDATPPTTNGATSATNGATSTTNGANTGDENEDTGKLSPTMYDLGTIRNSVSKNMTKMITAKLKTIKTEITTKFTDTFYQANYDCFDFDGDEIINEHLSSEFNATLKYLCEKIDEESAKSIFQNYVSRNKDELNLFFKDLFDNKIDNVNFYLFDLSKVNSFIFDNPDIIPTDFNINEPEDEEDNGTAANADAEAAAKIDANSPTNAANAKPPTNAADAAKNDAKSADAAKPEAKAAEKPEAKAAEKTQADEAEKTQTDAAANTQADEAEKTQADEANTQTDATAAVKTDDKEEAANAKSTLENDANSDSNDIKECKPDSKSDELLQIMKTENVHSYFSLITPSVITPVFEFLSETFNEATSKVEECDERNTETPFLCKLFALYSDKSIQFMETVNDDFVKNKDKILDYIERYVFTKHKYTKTLLTDLIKHTFDVKTLLKNDIKKDTITDLNDYFLKLVDLKINKTKITETDIPKFINNFTTETSLFQMINGLLNHQTEDIKNKYKEALKSMFP